MFTEELEDLEKFTQTTANEISTIAATLGWTLDSIDKTQHQTTLVTCPFDNSHKMPEMSLKGHLKMCKWKAEGYSEDDTPFPESTVPSSSNSTITFTESLLNEVLDGLQSQNSKLVQRQAGIGKQRSVPQTSNRLIADFSGDERKAIYDFCVANTAKVADIGQDIADIGKESKKGGDKDKKISYLELLAQERNLKRRRAKHRGVHTNKKSQVEILREVINQQMEIFAEYIDEQKPPPEGVRPSDVEESIGTIRSDVSEKREKSNENQESKRRQSSSGNGREERKRSRSHSRKKKKRSERERGRSRERDPSGERYRHKSKKRHRSRSRNSEKRYYYDDRRRRERRKD